MNLHNDFLDFDMRLSLLKDNYLIQASELYTTLNEAAPPNTSASSDWYIKWKAETTMTLKNSFAQAKQYADKMATKYEAWLKNNREYFDPNKYGVPSGCTISKAPDYRQAIFRIKEPLANALNGISIDKIQAGDDPNKADGNNADNRWFMKFLIKSYNGTGEDFGKFAKDYYAGNDNLNTINAHDMKMYIPIMHNFCLSYPQIIHNLENQLQMILTWIALDPVSGQQNTTTSPEQQLQQLQQNKVANQMASTNPQQNVVHAAADYLAFRESCIVLNEYINVQQSGTARPIVNTNMAQNSYQSKQSFMINNKNNQQHNLRNNPTQQQQNQQMKAQVNQKQLLMKKKQTAVNLVKDCFASKVTAAGMIYRDFIATLQTYIYGIQQKITAQNKKQAKSIKKQVKPEKEEKKNE